jgi:hypothetical protein
VRHEVPWAVRRGWNGSREVRGRGYLFCLYLHRDQGESGCGSRHEELLGLVVDFVIGRGRRHESLGGHFCLVVDDRVCDRRRRAGRLPW